MTASALLVKYLQSQRLRFSLLAVLLLGSISLQLVGPQLLRRFIDAAISGTDSGTLTVIALLFISLALGNQLLFGLTTYVGETVAWNATNRLRADLFQHCLELDLSAHNAYTPGELIERTDGDVNTLASFFSQFIILILGNSLLLVGVLILLFREDWRIGLALTAFVIVTLTLLINLRDVAVPFWINERQAQATFLGFLEERLSGTEDIRASGATDYVLRRFYELMRMLLHTSLKAYLMLIVVLSTTLGLFALGMLIDLGIGLYLLERNLITIGTLYLIFHYTQTLRFPLEQIRDQVGALGQARASIRRIRQLFETQSKIQYGSSTSLPPGPLDVEFENVTLRYVEDKEEAALHNISFNLEAGSVLGLLGRTGSGKTTLIRLLSKLYEPTEGVIRLGGVDIKQISLADARQRISLVTQDVQLFHGSLRDNLTFFNRDISDQQILQAFEEMGLSSWYQLLPAGLDTRLEAGQVGLSAGEAQLLAFTRAFLKDPDLVILDEASSRLDPATEQLIGKAVNKLLFERRRTGIIIAHRLATIQRVDEIMILKEGRISEHGRRAQLMNVPHSHFYQLLQSGREEVFT